MSLCGSGPGVLADVPTSVPRIAPHRPQGGARLFEFLGYGRLVVVVHTPSRHVLGEGQRDVFEPRLIGETLEDEPFDLVGGRPRRLTTDETVDERQKQDDVGHRQSKAEMSEGEATQT